MTNSDTHQPITASAFQEHIHRRRRRCTTTRIRRPTQPETSPPLVPRSFLQARAPVLRVDPPQTPCLPGCRRFRRGSRRQEDAEDAADARARPGSAVPEADLPRPSSDPHGDLASGQFDDLCRRRAQQDSAAQDPVRTVGQGDPDGGRNLGQAAVRHRHHGPEAGAAASHSFGRHRSFLTASFRRAAESHDAEEEEVVLEDGGE